MENLCRTCLRIPLKMFSIFEDKHLPSKIKAISNVEVSIEDQLPQMICKECIGNVDFAFNFRNIIINNNTDLKKRLKNSIDDAQKHENSIKFEEDATTPEEGLRTEIFSKDSESMLGSDEVKKETQVTKSKLKIGENNTQTAGSTPENYENVPSKPRVKTKKKLHGSNSTLANDGNKVTVIRGKVTSKQTEKSHSCEVCNFSTPVRAEWRKHYRSTAHLTSTNKSRKCGDCEFTTTDFKEWQRHLRQHLASRPKLRECNECQFSTADWHEFQRHRRIHNESYGHTLRECKKCGFKTVDFREWDNHRSGHRGKRKKYPSRCRKEERGTSSVCSVCGKTVRILWSHMLTHTAIKPVKCNQCGKSFKTNGTLRYHQRVHQGKVYTCEVCGMGITYYSTFLHHKRKHSTKDERKIKCTLCEKRFYHNRGLRDHMRTHTGERPFACSHCPKQFSRGHNLKIHMRLHTENASKHADNKPDQVENSGQTATITDATLVCEQTE